MNEKKLHGNSARIDPAKHFPPLFDDYLSCDYRPERYDRCYDREDEADFIRDRTDDIKL